jgi:predicted lipoprotein with Yx(FWY)xxD motif/uncharacterized cupredoxin-like copper-binding protein
VAGVSSRSDRFVEDKEETMVKRVWLLISVLLALGMPSTFAVAQEGDDEEETSVGWSEDADLGIFLTTTDGMTLYVFKNDKPGAGKSSCDASCAENWPPFTAEEPLTLPAGVPGELSTVTRDDGTTQVAYDGMPLYTFVKDTQPGETNGQGVGGNWFVASVGAPDGATPAASPVAITSGAGEAVVAVELTEFSIAPSEMTLDAGQEYTFIITNTGVLIHEFVIEPAGAEDAPLEAGGVVSEVEDIHPGDTAQLSWTFEPGEYQIACHIPGHLEAGMIATFSVE